MKNFVKTSVFLFATTLSIFARGSDEPSLLKDSDNYLSLPISQTLMGRASEYLLDSWQIAKEALKERDLVAAFSASSPWVVNKLVDNVRPTDGGPKRYLELGTGPGTVLTGLLSIMKQHNDDTVDAVEINPRLCAYTRKKIHDLIGDNPNVRIHEAAAQDWQPELDSQTGKPVPYDGIISTLPLTRFGTETLEKIAPKIPELLKPDGKFTFVTLMGATTLASWFGGQEFAKKDDLVKTWQQKCFNPAPQGNDGWELVWPNITPMYIRTLVRNGTPIEQH